MSPDASRLTRRFFISPLFKSPRPPELRMVSLELLVNGWRRAKGRRRQVLRQAAEAFSPEGTAAKAECQRCRPAKRETPAGRCRQKIPVAEPKLT